MKTKKIGYCAVLSFSQIEPIRNDNKRFYFEMCGLSSVYAYALTDKAYYILKELENKNK